MLLPPLKLNQNSALAAKSHSVRLILVPPPPVSEELAPGLDGTALSLTGTHACQHYHAFIASLAALHGRPPYGPPGYFTNNLLLISHCAPPPVIKEPINGVGKGEAFKKCRQLFFSV